jgi:hypothetical protein
LIEIPPRFVLHLTLLSNVPTEAVQHLTLLPAATQEGIAIGRSITGRAITSNGTIIPFNKTLDQLDALPAKVVEGYLYFIADKTANQRHISCHLELVDGNASISATPSALLPRLVTLADFKDKTTVDKKNN